MLALVWAPIRFAPGWAFAGHLFDFVAFSLLVAATRGAVGPFFLCFLFLLVCGALRWQVKGTLWTAAATIAAYAGISLYASNVLLASGFELKTFLIRTVYLTVVTVTLAILSAHQYRFQREIGQIAAWPRHVGRDPRAVVSEILSQVGTAPRDTEDPSGMGRGHTGESQAGVAERWGDRVVRSTESGLRPAGLAKSGRKEFPSNRRFPGPRPGGRAFASRIPSA